MGLFKKKRVTIITELKCEVNGCSFTCNDHKSLQRHKGWKHPEMTQGTAKVK